MGTSITLKEHWIAEIWIERETAWYSLRVNLHRFWKAILTFVWIMPSNHAFHGCITHQLSFLVMQIIPQAWSVQCRTCLKFLTLFVSDKQCCIRQFGASCFTLHVGASTAFARQIPAGVSSLIYAFPVQGLIVTNVQTCFPFYEGGPVLALSTDLDAHVGPAF